MAFWSKYDWLTCDVNNFPIEPREPNKVDEAGYRLSIGKEIYIPDENRSEVRHLAKGEGFSLQSGQFAFFLTEESVKIPRSMIGFISVRASIKFYGLVNVSGFHVDPGYNGKLIFAVFNSGPSRIAFVRGQEVFSLWVAELKTAISEIDAPKKSYNSITPEIINKLDGGHVTAFQMSQRIASLEEITKKNENKIDRMVLFSALFGILLGSIIAPYARDKLNDWFSSEEIVAPIPIEKPTN